ncbi:MAG: 16S rRNA (guanine(527)-N(7))-methyltransferase RsmG [Prevotella sp.]|jgi:16S rRNA (guanine(527)-N(7))-methyltransferase GidB|nr:16S rRNA (guanine(527)-N(7))-methyltransferase RsmG [Prevotella sp.]
MQIIDKYFPNLSQRQKEQFNNLDTLYREWNAKINVISRKDIDNLYEHHVLHSMAIARIVRFKPSTSILDFGTGGGFPGIPLAILFPECRFRLIDGTGKKVNVAAEIAKAIGLENVEAIHQRGEEEKGKFDFIVSRAVMPMPDLVKIVSKNISRKQHNSIANGILALKGGNLSAELKPYHKIIEVTPISQFFDEEWFREKSVIYLPM